MSYRAPMTERFLVRGKQDASVLKVILFVVALGMTATLIQYVLLPMLIASPVQADEAPQVINSVTVIGATDAQIKSFCAGV